MSHKINQVLAAVLLVVALLTGQQTWAANDWNVQATTSGSTTTFTISRTNTTAVETVKYRFVNLSAYAGQHYNVTKVNNENSSALSGNLYFAADEKSKTILVTESAGNTVYAYYKDATDCSYKLEVTDLGGFYLADEIRTFTKGTSIKSNNVYAEKSVTVNSGTITVTDAGFTQGYHAVPIADYYKAAAPKAYLLAAGAELRMIVELEEAEKDDGYQHIQLLVNQTSNCDNSASEGNPGTPTHSHYLASFAHEPSTKNGTFAKVCFPRTSSSDGKNADTWYAENTVAKITAVDVTAPTVRAYSVAPGMHANGDATRLNDNVKMINDKETDAWYTLDGRKLDGKPTRKGLYIKNGKKVIIK